MQSICSNTFSCCLVVVRLDIYIEKQSNRFALLVFESSTGISEAVQKHSLPDNGEHMLFRGYKSVRLHSSLAEADELYGPQAMIDSAALKIMLVSQR